MWLHRSNSLLLIRASPRWWFSSLAGLYKSNLVAYAFLQERSSELPSNRLQGMSESHKLLYDKPSSKHSPHASSLGQQYPVRRMRNTAVLVKWIEEHQSNPYPTKAEKQYLAYYSGMNLTQLSTWFANARRRIKKIGMKTWLEGRSTFTVDFFPSTPAAAFSTARPASYSAEYLHGGEERYISAASLIGPKCYIFLQATPSMPLSQAEQNLQLTRKLMLPCRCSCCG